MQALLTCLEQMAPARTANFGIKVFNHGADSDFIGEPPFVGCTATDKSMSDLGRLATLSIF